jgi:two-component system, OmpR family, phosphate regulon sensor histidine kinase PhoR
MNQDAKELIILVISDADTTHLLEQVLQSHGYEVISFGDRSSSETILGMNTPKLEPDLVIIGENLKDGSGFEYAKTLLDENPTMAVVLVGNQETPGLLKAVLHVGITDCISLPLYNEQIISIVQNSIQIANNRKTWTLRRGQKATHELQRKVSELETLARLVRLITSVLDPDMVLSNIVEAAVELTDAEDGSLLLLDDDTGELYMRASRNLEDQISHTFRLPVEDSLAGTVIQTGKPFVLDSNTFHKIKTSYLVKSLLYVPLLDKDRVIGVLGVDNRHKVTPFTKRHIQIVSALADFAVIGIDNATFYSRAVIERNKLETILSNIQDGVIVVDNDDQVVLANQTARDAFNLDHTEMAGKPLREVFTHNELLEIINPTLVSSYERGEINLADGRVFSAHRTQIPGVGLAVTMNDITSLKKLDRIKTDFVNTVSHDLRSPLTAILGYIELIERVSPVTDAQHEFIRRVQTSVHNITELVDDLLNLGRIEAGFDTHKDMVQIGTLIQDSVSNFRHQTTENEQAILAELPEQLPPIFGNPVQLRQIVDNLLDNALKYTPKKGIIRVAAKIEGEQFILQVSDTGIGIPVVDLPYIFDKFFRASNIDVCQSGTGLGLSIVKSIVESHHGRIWVDSIVNQGTKFTVILPVKKPGTQ